MSKSRKLSVTISKVNHPAFSAQCTQDKANTHIRKGLVSTKDSLCTEGGRDCYTSWDVSRGGSLYAHDLLQSNPVFVVDVTTKPGKALLVAELEIILTRKDPCIAGLLSKV